MSSIHLCLAFSITLFPTLVTGADDGRHVPLDGQPNFRDIGGYTTEDGMTVRRGIIYRSGRLPELTDADVAKLDRLGIRTVVNFLTPEEIEAAGRNRLPRDAREILLPIATEDGLVTDLIHARRTGDFSKIPADLNLQIHRRLVDEATDQYAALLREIVTSDEPTVFHCSHGIHRTGTAAAIVLWAVGVPWETIREDYLLSNRYRKEEIDRRIVQLRDLAAKKQNIAPEAVDTTNIRAFYVLQGEYIDSARDQILNRNGSIDAYLREELKLTSTHINLLRERLLEQPRDSGQ